MIAVLQKELKLSEMGLIPNMDNIIREVIEQFLSEAKYKEIPSGLLSEIEKNRILGLNNRNVFNYKRVKPVLA